MIQPCARIYDKERYKYARLIAQKRNYRFSSNSSPFFFLIGSYDQILSTLPLMNLYSATERSKVLI